MYFVYILSNKNRTVLSTGITNNLERRLYEHKNGITKGFTTKYHVYDLVYFETIENPSSAIDREKQIKGFSRHKKNALIESINPNWDNLAP